MVGRIYHVGLTVSDLDRSIAFYRDILRLEFQGEIFMEGEETDKMFRKENCKARVAYLNGSKALEAPPVELIQFVDSKIHKEQSDLFTTSISEVCFYTDDIDSVYKTLNSLRRSLSNRRTAAIICKHITDFVLRYSPCIVGNCLGVFSYHYKPGIKNQSDF